MTKPDKPENLETLLQGTLRQSFVGLISEEQWSHIVQSAWDTFFEPSKDHWNNNKESPFQSMVRNYMEALIKERLHNVLKAKLNALDYDDMAKQFMIQIAKATAPDIVEAFVAKVIATAGNSVVDHLRNNISQYLDENRNY